MLSSISAVVLWNTTKELKQDKKELQKELQAVSEPRAETEDEIPKQAYYYIDTNNCIHTTLNCVIINPLSSIYNGPFEEQFKVQMSTYQNYKIKRYTIEELNVEDYTCCSCCVSDEQYYKLINETTPYTATKASASIHDMPKDDKAVRGKNQTP